MADESFEIDIDVETKNVKKAIGALKRLKDQQDRLGKSGAKLAKVNQRIAGRQLREQLSGFKAIKREQDKVAKTMGSMRAGALGVLASLGAVVAKAGVVAATITTGIVAKFAAAVVGAKEFDLTTAAAFKSLTGDAASGAKAMATVEATADRLSLSTRETASQMKKLLAAQFSIGEADTFIALGADLRAIGATAEQANNAIRAITQIKAKGKFLQEEQQQLSEAGLSKELVDAALIKNLGLANKSALQKIQQAGKVTGNQALKAIQDAILTKTHGQAAGDAAAKFAEVSMESMGIRIKNAMDKLFRDVAATSPEAFKQLGEIGKGLTGFFKGLDKGQLGEIFTTAINGLNTLVELTKAFATGFIGGLAGEAGTLDEMFKNLARPENLEAVKAFGVSFAEFSATAIRLLGSLADIPKMFDGVGTAIAGAVLPITNIIKLFGLLIGKTGAEARVKMQANGSNLMAGFMAGIRNAIPGLNSLMALVGSTATVSTEKSLKIQSPSKVFEGIGENVVAGFNKGVEAPSMSAAARGKGASAGTAGGGIGTTVNNNFGGMAVNSEINEAQDAGAVAAKVEQMVNTVMGRAFESMALQSGVA